MGRAVETRKYTRYQRVYVGKLNWASSSEREYDRPQRGIVTGELCRASYRICANTYYLMYCAGYGMKTFEAAWREATGKNGRTLLRVMKSREYDLCTLGTAAATAVFFKREIGEVVGVDLWREEGREAVPIRFRKQFEKHRRGLFRAYHAAEVVDYEALEYDF